MASAMVQEMLELDPSSPLAPLSPTATDISSSSLPIPLKYPGSSLISPERTPSGAIKVQHSQSMLEQHHLTTTWLSSRDEREGYERGMEANAWSRVMEEEQEEEEQEDEETKGDAAANKLIHCRDPESKDSTSSCRSCNTSTFSEDDIGNGIFDSCKSASDTSLAFPHRDRLSHPCFMSGSCAENKELSSPKTKEILKIPETLPKSSKKKGHPHKLAEGGFFTMRPMKSKSKEAKPSKRFSFKSRKGNSVGVLDISNPSLVTMVRHQDASTLTMPLVKQSAIEENGADAVGPDVGQQMSTHLEVSYSFEVQHVNVLFNGDTMKVECRGEQPCYDNNDEI